MADLARLSASAVATSLAPGHRFINESAPAEDFFTLVTGTVKLMKSLADGRQHITSFAGPGDFLGLALDDRYAYSAEAVDAVKLCRMPRRGLRLLIADFPGLEARLLEITRHELVLAQEQMLLLGCKTACERLASFLLQRAGTAVGASVTVQLPMSRGDIGDYLGLRVETVCRMLTRMRIDRVIAILPASAGVTSSIVIRDMAMLTHLAALG